MDALFCARDKKAINEVASLVITAMKDPGLLLRVFWHIECVILVEMISRCETTSSKAYTKTLTKLSRRIRRVRPPKNPT